MSGSCCFPLKKKGGGNLFSYKTAEFWVSSACRPKHSTELWGAGTTATVMDTWKPYICLPVRLLLAREHCVRFLSAGLLPGNVVLEGPGIQHLHCPIRGGRSMKNQREESAWEAQAMPTGHVPSSLLSAYCFTALLWTFIAEFSKAEGTGAPHCSW